MRILLNSVIKLTKLFDHTFVRLKNQSSDFKEMIGLVKSIGELFVYLYIIFL